MMQKYPNDELPYRFRRKRPAACCISRAGIAKGRWRSEETAKAFLKRKQMNQTHEPYPCKQFDGNWHIRTMR